MRRAGGELSRGKGSLLMYRQHTRILAALLLAAAVIIWPVPGKAALLSTGKRQIILTFDDGPHPSYTPQVLDTLEHHGIKAIFFVVGQEANRYPELVADIHRRGHLLGNHTHTHRNLTGLPRADLLSELVTTDTVVAGITGQPPVYFRPPRGNYDIETQLILAETGHVMLMWDVCLENGGPRDPQQTVNGLLSRISWRKKVIILMHDGDPSGRHSRQTTVESLPILITELKKRNYHFVNPASTSGSLYLAQYSEASLRHWSRDPRSWAGGLLLLATISIIARNRWPAKKQTNSTENSVNQD